jgi:hypothetical protein
MIDLSSFRKNASERGICSEKASIWDKCTNKKDLMDLALSAQGMDYICDSIAKGWGISPSYIAERFKGFNNGRYVYYSPTGYKTAMYCGYRGMFLCELTALMVIDSEMDITIPDYHICEIYAVGNTHLRLHGKGRCRVLVYGDDDSVKIDADSSVVFTRKQKRDRD